MLTIEISVILAFCMFDIKMANKIGSLNKVNNQVSE
jgi:hypothetical protein